MLRTLLTILIIKKTNWSHIQTPIFFYIRIPAIPNSIYITSCYIFYLT